MQTPRGKAAPKHTAPACPKITFPVLTLGRESNKSQIRAGAPCCGTKRFLLATLGPCASPAIPTQARGEGGISGVVSREELQTSPDFLAQSQGINRSHPSRAQAEPCLSAAGAAGLLQQQADTCKTPSDRATVAREAA